MFPIQSYPSGGCFIAYMDLFPDVMFKEDLVIVEDPLLQNDFIWEQLQLDGWKILKDFLKGDQKDG